MKLRYASLALAAALVLALPAMANTLYSNGPINGGINAYTTNFGWEVSDSFTLAGASKVTAFDGGFWVYPGDSPTSTSWDITSGGPSNAGGTVVASGSGSYSSALLCGGCAYGYDIYRSTISGLSVNLGAGTYYLELFNATSAYGYPVYWDENDGPSTAYQQGNGNSPYTIGSQAFDVYGVPTPEPGSLMLLGSGVIGLAGMLRRKISL